MKREELKSIFDALRNDPQHHLGLGDIRLTIAQQDEILAMFSPLPPAEGVDEILQMLYSALNHDYDMDGFGNGYEAGIRKCIEIVENNSSLHAQQQPTAEGAEETAQRCPVCGGNGLVANGFYNQTSGYWSTSSISPETCRTCNGTGVILPSYLHAQQIADKMVGERLREELGKFIKWYNSGYEQARKPHLIVKEYLKSREQ